MMNNGMQEMMQGGNAPMAGGMMLYGLLWLILLVLVITALALGIIFLARRLTGQNTAKQPGHTALDLLKERYAKGEINREEYQNIKADLESPQ